jgi:phosphonopyruvate decarboxylase
MSGQELAALFEGQGFDCFTGVPCSLIAGLIGALETHPRRPYVPAVREDLAVGLAGGAWLGGRRPAVLIQNSGLGTSLNALASLSLLYRLPVLLFVTWRGHRGADAPEHILMGEVSPALFELLGIPHRVLADRIDADIAWARDTMERRMQPVALLLPPGILSVDPALPVVGRPAPPAGAAPAFPDAVPGAAAGSTRATARTLPATLDSASATRSDAPETSSPGAATRLEPRLSRLEALRAAVGLLGDAPVIHANGYICRESFSLGDRPQNFYMIGSMGLAAAIGLGLAGARRAGPTVVFDGDGNLLMSLGVLAMIGSGGPTNLVHCVFDNEVYGSTGDQRSVSRDVRLDGLARAAGYRTVAAVTTADEIDATLRIALGSAGPHFVLIKTTTETTAVPRIPHAPTAIRDRFRASL